MLNVAREVIDIFGGETENNNKGQSKVCTSTASIM
ncbi:MAG: hypothetical protein ACI8RD_005714 [Bacillariaceae sp.]|jgi:hypothetical protein